MSAISHVGTVIVPVADPERALAFYRDTLGFEVRIDGMFGDGARWLEVAPRGAETSLALVPANGMEVSLASRDAAADHAALRGAEADADAALIELGEGVPPMFTFRDADGNRFRVVERD
jgi:catechol 2,3-dioxygenase-like lactoylglutathione lyase family enzyme